MKFYLVLILTLALSLAHIPCSTNSDCPKRTDICSNSSCIRKGVFPLIIQDFLSAFLVAIGVILSNASGLGGGAITIAILVSVMNFTPVEAIPIANFCMFMGAVARLLISLKEKHPHFPHRPAIHYEFIIILLPLALVGALLGALVNFTFPEIILTLLIIILFALVIVKSIHKAIQIRNANKRKALQKQEEEDEDELLPYDLQADQKLTYDQKERRAAQMKLEKSHCQSKKIILILSVFLCLVVVSLFQRGALARPLGIYRCSPADWIIQLTFLIVCVIAATLAGCVLIKDNQLREELFIPIDVKWTKRQVSIYSLISILIGVVSAALGIGGGIIITPLLFSTGQPPTVASLTSIYIIFFISLGSTIIFISNGKFLFGYGAVYGIIVLLGSFLGLWILKRYIQKKGGQIVIVILLIIVSFIALALLLMVSIQKILNAVSQGQGLLSFQSLCS